MAITKTGITVSATGENDKTFEVDGQQSTVTATGLKPSKQYTVSAYVIDSDYGKINAAQTSTFTTLVAGDITISNINAYWDTQTAKFHFECDWASIYPISGSGAALANNFRGYVSQNPNFTTSQQINTGWTRQADGLSGTINAQPTVLIPETPNSSYYLKLVFIDSQGFEIEKTFRYDTPVTQQGGTFSFSYHVQANNNVWFPTQTTPSSFAYYPKQKRILATKDNWQTIAKYSGWYNWPNNTEIFVQFDPDDYVCEMEIKDIYGNVFRSNQNSQVRCPQPMLFASADNSRGQIYMWLKLNTNLPYTTCQIYYYSQDQQYSQTIDLSSNPQAIQYFYEDVPDGSYTIELSVVAGSYSYSTTANVDVKCTGYVEISDASVFEGEKMMFKANYQMGKYGADTTTFQVRVYDENDNLLDDFTPTVTGDSFTGALTKATGISLPPKCEYVGYLVEVTNKGGYTNSDWIDIDLS